MNISDFAVKKLRKYANEKHTIVRGTSDLSPLEEWLILEMFKTTEDINDFLSEVKDVDNKYLNKIQVKKNLEKILK